MKNSKELINTIATQLDCTKTKAREIYDVVCNIQRDCIISEGKYRFPSVGTIKVVDRAARDARNPINGKPLKVPAKKAVVLKASVSMKEAVN